MKLKAVALLPCVAFVLLAFGTAHADPINGSVYENQAAYPAILAPPTGAPSATFTTSNLNYFSDTSNYTIAGFLGAGTTLSSPVGGDTLNNTIFDFTGSVNLVNGQTYSITHDDGMELFINGNYSNGVGRVIDSRTPTAAEASSFVYTGTTGVQTFDLLYTEVNGAPATLNALAFVPAAVTPEPGTFALMGTGLLTMAGLVRRRLRA